MTCGPHQAKSPQHNVDVDSSKVKPLFQHCFVLFVFVFVFCCCCCFLGGGGKKEPGKLNNDFPLQNNVAPVGILSSVPRNFGQDCMYMYSDHDLKCIKTKRADGELQPLEPRNNSSTDIF